MAPSRRRGRAGGRGAGRAGSTLLACALSLAVVAGTTVALRPFVVEAVSADELRQSSVSFARQAEASDDARLAVEQASSINAALAARDGVSPSAAPDGYWSWAGADSRGRIATVEAEAADVCAPVWQGTSDSDLSRGLGHMPGTSLPVGGESTRCVVVGHTDYQDQTLFSHIDRLRPGDEVRVTSAAGTLVYEVRDSRVIEPTDLDALAIEPGQDVLTLLTCWPPSVNTSRLIVNCVRTGTELPASEGVASMSDVPWWRTSDATVAACTLAVAAAGTATYAIATPGAPRRGRGRASAAAAPEG